MKKCVLIETDSCVSCIGLQHELNQLLAENDEIELEIHNNRESAQPYLEKYEVEKLPCVMLLENDQLLGKLYGYQPTFILEVWLEDIVKGEN